MGEMVNRIAGYTLGMVLSACLISGAAFALESTFVGTGMQCPNDVDNRPFSLTGIAGPEDFDRNGNGIIDVLNSNAVCKRVGVTDGYVMMPDGTYHYQFGFVDLTGVPENEIVNYKGHAHMPAPPIEVMEGQSLYLTETNLSLFARPDLFDPHTIHFHGFPHAMGVFDGVPENSIAINGGFSFTYYYKTNDPGTYPYHCHVEPVEHIQLGMVGTIVVKPNLANHVYDDTTGGPDTSYDKAYTFLITEVDPDKHWNLEDIQEGTNLWSDYYPSYYTINGRSYPDTVKSDLDPTMIVAAGDAGHPSNDSDGLAVYPDGISGAPGYISGTSSLIEAQPGERILVRVNNMGFQTHTLTIPGIPMHIIGEDAKLLKGPTGLDLSFKKTTYSLAGGKTAEILLEIPIDALAGTYFMYARELNAQSNLSREDRLAGLGNENRGGMMTEIRIAP